MSTSFPKKVGHSLLAASIFALGTSIVSIDAQAEDFGPVPAIKTDPKKAALGKRLFFDKRLSGDASMSCSTCHQQENAFEIGHAFQSSHSYAGKS